MRKIKMLNLLQFLTLGIMLQSCIESIQCNCLLKYPQDRQKAPLYKKVVGTKTFYVPFNEQAIVLMENEYITGYCDTNFSDLVQYTGGWSEYENVASTRELTMYCENNVLHYENKNPLRNDNEAIMLECETMKWSLYESTIRFPWCESTAASYSLISMSRLTPETLADVCFDVEHNSIKSIYYRTIYIQYIPDLPGDSMRNRNFTHIGNFETIFNYKSITDLQNTLNTETHKNYWLQFANYEYHSLVQGSRKQDNFEQHPLLLSVIWWRNLLYGNWKNYTDALQVRYKYETYEIYAGYSGQLRVPTPKKGISGEIVELAEQHIAAYIWQYLKADDSLSTAEEYVIIGYNSPFFDFFDEKDIIFCKDVCEQISWLNDARSTFRKSVLGVVFCCSAEEVLSSNRLDGFYIAPKEITTTTTMATTDETTEDYNSYQSNESNQHDDSAENDIE